MTFKFVHQLTSLRKTLYKEVSRRKMEDHQGDGTRIIETHLPVPCFPAQPPQLRSLRGTERQHVQSLPSNATCGTCLSKQCVSRVLAADTVSTVESRSPLEPHRLRVQPQTRSVGMPCSATSRFPSVPSRPAEFIC